MHIHCLGLNHNTAPLALRERIAFGEDALRAALSRLACGGETQTAQEMVILSTCNRVEVYAASNRKSFAELEAFLSQARGVHLQEIRPHLYRLADEQAVKHLLEVAAGLDSLVLGEPQILGQVTRALELARGAGAAGATLNRIFQAAIHAGKRARTETGIARNPASVSSLAAALAEKVVHPLSQARVVIVGAGEMAELAVEALRKRGANNLLVVNRSLERAQGLAQRWNAQADTFENLETALQGADVLIASTGAPHLILSAEMAQRALQTRPQRPLVLIDIAVPRDIDPLAANLPNLQLYDMDGLRARLEDSLAERAAETPHVRAILEEEAARLMEFLRSMKMLPLIAELRQRAEAIRQAELERALRHLDLSDSERERIEAMTQALVKKILQEPTQRLRAEAACPHAPEYATVTRTLFGLQAGEGLCSFSGSVCPLSAAD